MTMIEWDETTHSNKSQGSWRDFEVKISKVLEDINIDPNKLLGFFDVLKDNRVDGVAGGASALEPLGIANPSQCVLAAPVILGDETLGVVVAESDRADTWNPMYRPLAKAFASVLAGFVDTERNSRPERRVAERDLLLAPPVQQHFLPQSSLRIDGYQLADSYAPARVVGGDHYAYFRFADDRVGMIIADVSGKAVSAALVMARFGMALRLMASQASTPLDLLVTLNVLLLDELETGMFVTARVLALSPQSGEIEIANAGHPSPLLRSAQGSISELAMDPGAALGAGAQTLFRASRFTGMLPIEKLRTHTITLDEINVGFDRLAVGKAVRQVIAF